MIRDTLSLNDKIITPIFTEDMAGGKRFIHGEDEQGPYIAYRLDNIKRSKFFGWYIKISPEDKTLIHRYAWYGNVTKQSVEVRRRESIEGKQHSFQLSKEIWERMNREEVCNIHRLGHLLDFRRCNLSSFSIPSGCRGVVRHKRDGCWQVQINVSIKTTYICTTQNFDDGCREYNRYLRDLKENYPDQQKIQNMPYNQVVPMF